MFCCCCSISKVLGEARANGCAVRMRGGMNAFHGLMGKGAGSYTPIHTSAQMRAKTLRLENPSLVTRGNATTNKTNKQTNKQRGNTNIYIYIYILAHQYASICTDI